MLWGLSLKAVRFWWGNIKYDDDKQLTKIDEEKIAKKLIKIIEKQEKKSSQETSQIIKELINE